MDKKTRFKLERDFAVEHWRNGFVTIKEVEHVDNFVLPKIFGRQGETSIIFGFPNNGNEAFSL